jgi:transmembrane sensor
MAKSKTTKSFRTAALISKYLREPLTGREEIELYDWVKKSTENQQLFRDLCNTNELQKQLELFEQFNTPSAWQRLQEKLATKVKGKAKPGYRRIWWQAAAAILILAFATWQLTSYDFNKPASGKEPAGTYGQEIQPGTFKAELILSNGKRISLDSNGDTSFTENGTVVERISDGTLKYGGGESFAGNIAWNTLHIPNAGEYVVTLADGTKVWLNAATTLRYPVQFTGKERRVELPDGEAYFEVAKNKEKPFIVVTDQMEIQAVGTAFNVNNYAVADSSMSATLTEGKVKVKTRTGTLFLIPGEQANVNKKGVEKAKADVEQVTAWKNGRFIFNNSPLGAVMQQLSRWYDVQVRYDKSFKEKKFFTGEIKRDVPISKLLKMMELTGIASFRIANNTVLVLPNTK